MQRTARTLTAVSASLALSLATWLVGATSAAGATPAAAPAATVTITLNGTTATSSSTTGVTISSGTVTITAAGTYQFTGKLTNGQVVVNAPETAAVELILSGASITSTTTAALYVKAAQSVRITLAAGTSNQLADAATYVYPDPKVKEPDAALFSKEDLTFGGTGSLSVKGTPFDGIASNDNVVVESGTITVDARSVGIKGKDYVKINGGTVKINSNADGLRATNKKDPGLGYVAITGGNLSITAATDCVQGHSGITISGGTQTLSCTETGLNGKTATTVSDGVLTITNCKEGISGTKVTLSGGATTITSSDDGINGADGVTDKSVNAAAVVVAISGGTNVVTAVGDGLDSNGALHVTGGTTVVNGPSADAHGAVHANGAFTVSGGTLLATGSAAKAQTPVVASSEGHLAYKFGTAQASGTIVQLVPATGTALPAYRSGKQFQWLLFASPAVVSGSGYRVYTGGSVTGTAIGGGLYPGGSTTGATQVGSVTAIGGIK